MIIQPYLYESYWIQANNYRVSSAPGAGSSVVRYILMFRKESVFPSRGEQCTKRGSDSALCAYSSRENWKANIVLSRFLPRSNKALLLKTKMDSQQIVNTWTFLAYYEDPDSRTWSVYKTVRTSRATFCKQLAQIRPRSAFRDDANVSPMKAVCRARTCWLVHRVLTRRRGAAVTTGTAAGTRAIRTA